jgi:3D (Asp-Asp-Asp) domain-containing protein
VLAVPASASTSTVYVTAYCQSGRTASGIETRHGIVATRSAIPFGTTVRIAGETYTVADRMAPYDLAAYDLFMPSCTDAISWGIRTEKVTILGEPTKAGRGRTARHPDVRGSEIRSYKRCSRFQRNRSRSAASKSLTFAVIWAVSPGYHFASPTPAL